MKNGLLSGDSNTLPVGRESSALTTRPRHLVFVPTSLYLEEKQTFIVHAVLPKQMFTVEVRKFSKQFKLNQK